jgi:uncharacterized YigZ family protein
LNQWKKEHHQARHLCYAYRLGYDYSIFRANDDGEPNNSAGIPILGQIQSFELTNVLIGVIRYFGGTKLGVGGLITAYKTAAKEALENAFIEEKEIMYGLKLEFNYDLMPQIMSYVKKHELNIIRQEFELDCMLEIEFPFSKKDFILNELNDFQNLEVTDLGIL